MKKVNQRVIITKKMLEDALLCLLSEKPIDKINITELCNEAGINRATFYSHYETPRDILVEIEQRMTSELNEKLKQNAQNCQTVTEAMCQYIYDNSEIIRVFLQNFTGNDLAQILNNRYEAVIESTIAQDVDADYIKLAITYLTGGGFFLITQWLQTDIQKTPKEISELITSLISDNVLGYLWGKN